MTTSSTTSTTGAISTATQQLLTSLNTGSGVDTGSLVTSLVQAEFAARTDALKSQSDTLTAQLSGVSTLRNTISQFSTALDALTKNGTLGTQLTSSDASVLSATTTSGGTLPAGTRTVTVNKLAVAQTAQTTDATISDRAAKQFTGTLTLTIGKLTANADGSATAGGTPFDIKLDNASLDDVAKAINGAAKGVTASVVTDGDGTAYLSLKGATGAANGFTISTSDGTPSTASAGVQKSLAMFAVGGPGGGVGATTATPAADADLTVDGIHVTRASNTVTDLIDGATVTLAKAGVVTLTSSTPTAALTEAVNDFVSAYNQVLTTVTGLTDPISGALRSDPAAKTLLRNLKQLTGTGLIAGAAAGTPTTLSEIGVGTNRDGTLQVDPATLTTAIKTWPGSVGAMFGTATTSVSLTGAISAKGDGISALLINLAASASDKSFGLGASEATYTAQQTRVSSDQDDLTAKSTAEATRLTQQFASMNSKVSAYKSTQAFLTNQIDAWNSKN